MGFLHPELLLLGIPAACAWWWLRGPVRATAVVRALVLAALVLALAQPYLRTAQRGRDLVIVADRSRSMPAEGRTAALEIARLAEDERRDGDRVAVVGFGARAGLEQLPSASAHLQRFEREVDPDGSDLAEALETALELVPGDRQGAILLLSDGENNGRDPLPAARRAFARGVRIDVRPFPRANTADLSIERIDLPETAAMLEPFQFSVWVHSDRRVEGDFTLERHGAVLSSGRRVFEAGMNRIVLRDVIDEAGIGDYRVRVDAGEDRVPENNSAIGALRVEGARSILVVNDDGAEDTLVRVLRAARIPVKLTSPENARLDALSLAAHRAVVLENVAAGRLGGGLRSLARFVVDRGGGLCVTGGKASFGTGGYFRSVLDPLLPVSMEMRQEHRKQAIALAIALDRSGSMSAPAGGGLIKMDLANLGTAAAIELLAPIDSVAVIAVDSAPHVVQELAPVVDVPELAGRVKGIDVGGGGIFTYTALVAAAQQLSKAEQTTRHIIIFADAADAEEPGDYVKTCAELVRAGVTVSVIGLGSESDVDAEFLKDLAAKGGGQIYFTTDPSELPRLFAQDTLAVSRATFVEEPTACRVLPDLFGLGEVPGGEFARLDGYNLTYLRSGAIAGVATQDEYQAPVFAFMQQGLGRTAAFTGQIGGTYGGSVVAWPGFASFFVSITRWLVGQEEPGEVFASLRREGKDVVVSVEVEPEHSARIDGTKARVKLLEPDGTTRDLALERTADNRYEARAPLAKDGIELGTLALADGRSLQLPPIALPYSPEFERGPDPLRGERILREIAQESGGLVDPAATEFFRGSRDAKGWRLVSRELALAALLLLLLEIAARRLELWGLVRLPQRVKRAPPEPEPARPAPVPVPTEPAAREDVESALTRARRAAKKRLDR